MTKENILIVFDHVGGFMFMKRYLKEIQNNGNFFFFTTYENLKYLKEFEKKKIKIITSKVSIEGVVDFIKNYNIKKLLFATSETYNKKFNIIEPIFLKASIVTKIKSICFLDYYTNLKQRLNYPKKIRGYLKPTILFIDSEYELECKNFIKHFNNIFFIKNLEKNYISKAFYDSLFLSLNKNKKAKNIIFFSQPLSERGLKKIYGYDEFDVLNLVISQLNQINQINYKYTLTIVNHPSENKNKFKLLKNRYINFSSLDKLNMKIKDQQQIVLIVGMFSTILNPIKSVFNNVLSIQPIKNKKHLIMKQKCDIIIENFDIKKFFDKKLKLSKNFLNNKQVDLTLKSFKKIYEKI